MKKENFECGDWVINTENLIMTTDTPLGLKKLKRNKCLLRVEVVNRLHFIAELEGRLRVFEIKQFRLAIEQEINLNKMKILFIK